MIQSREQPGFDLRAVAQLMAFARPGVKSLLGQVARVIFISSQAECELIKGGIILAHKQLKFLLGSHATVIFIMSH